MLATLVTIFASTLVLVGCQRVPLTAPSGSSITLTASATALALNGTAQIVAQVVEAAGIPPHSGTHINFTTTLGTVDPSDVETDTEGRAITTFKAGTTNGNAIISATSGGASASGTNAIKIAVGTAAVGRVTVTASPSLLPATGGTTTITALVFDINGNVLPSALVSFSTTAGTLDTAVVTTDQNGAATARLTTATTATVTGSVGAQGGSSGGGGTGGGGTGGGGTGGGGTGGGNTSGQASGTATVNVAGAPGLVITPPTTVATAGLPASYAFVVTAATTNGSAIRDLTVDWGDGSGPQDLGAVTGTANVSHTYRAPGSYTIRATLTDAAGTSVPASTVVAVNPAALLLTITAPTTPPGVGLPATFTIVVGALPTGDTVRNVHVDWGDGTSADLGALTGSTTVTHVYQTAGTFAVNATLTDTAGNSSPVATSVTVVPTALPTIIITPSGTATPHPVTVTFQIQITTPAGVGITNAVINFGDGSPASSLGGVSGNISVPHLYSNMGSFTVTVTVTDTLGRSTQGSTTVTIS